MSADVPLHEPDLRPITADDLHARPPAPPPVLRGSPPDALERVRRSPAATKLRILLACHEAAAHARRLRALASFAKGVGILLLGLVFGALAGLAAFLAIYNNPERDVQRYTQDGWTYAYYIKGEQSTQQEYDYYLATHSNMSTAVSAAIAAGLIVLVVFVTILLVRRGRTAPPAGGADEQVAAIVRDHPDAVREWGGPSVLREQMLVREILRIEERQGR